MNALPARDVEGGSKTVRGHQADDVVFYGRISQDDVPTTKRNGWFSRAAPYKTPEPIFS